uniref:TBC1 domain family member 22B-like n=1 Tax=Styela clava TaxID=7725 RepID=UPI001939DBE5|nr:TBC1 domain family member 22B-like [Styela clava]
MSSKSPSKVPFWKRSSPKMPGGSIKSSTQNISPVPRHKLSFKEFEHHTEDAWDASEDDLLRDAVSKINIHPEHAKESAKAVIASHSKRASLTSSNNDSKNKSTADEKVLQNSTMKFPGGASRTVPSVNVSEEESVKKNSTEQNISEQVTQDDEKSDKSQAHITTPPNNSKDHRNDASNAPNTQSMRAPLQTIDKSRETIRISKFKNLIDSPNTDLSELRELSWSGIPACMRPDTWRVLCDYMPANKERRESVLIRKRKEYFNFVRDYYDRERQGMHKETFHQIHIDIPRTNPLIPLFQMKIVQEMFERLLFIWAIRHPASGYVQGINDLVTPFFIVFLSEQISADDDVETYDVSQLSQEILDRMEADTYWCTSKLLDGIQDNYTFAQPGVQTKVQRLKELNRSVDEQLHNHLECEQVEYLQFAFRWMNNLLMREIPLRCTIRLWDTYLAETEGFSDFHLYVCVAFLRQWRKQLLEERDFQGLMLRLQNVPTHHWGDEEIGLLIAEAFRLRYTYEDAKSHLAAKR